MDNDRFTLDLLEVLVKGGKEAQAISIGKKGNTSTSSESRTSATATSDTQSTSVGELTVEIEKIRLTLKETQRDLDDKSEQLEAVVSERDNLRRVSEHGTIAAPSEAAYSVSTPSKAIGMARDESIQDILTTLSYGDDGGSEAGASIPDTISEGTEKTLNGHGATPKRVTNNGAELQTQRINDLSSEIEALRSSLDHSTQVLNEKSEELEAALEDNESLRDRLRSTPDIDEETIHYIVKNITSYDDQRMETFQSGDEEEDASSVESSASLEDEGKRQKNEELSNFASAMFSTGKFLVDRELFEDSIVCFETVLVSGQELYRFLFGIIILYHHTIPTFVLY